MCTTAAGGGVGVECGVLQGQTRRVQVVRVNCVAAGVCLYILEFDGKQDCCIDGVLVHVQTCGGGGGKDFLARQLDQVEDKELFE